MIPLEGLPSRILIVDDRASVREGLAERIADAAEQFRTEVAGTAEEALERLAGTHFDMVLCDLRLKGQVTGIELTQEITARNPEVRVVVFSGKEIKKEEKHELLQAGALFYLSKPIDFQELLNAIEKINAIRRTERQNRWFEQLARLSHELQRSFDPDVIARKIVRGACDLGYRRARLYLLDPERATLVGKASCGMGAESTIEGYEIPLVASPLIQQIFRADRPTVWNRHFLEENFGRHFAEPWLTDLGLSEIAWVDCPLLVGRRRIGTLSVDHLGAEETSLSEDDRRILGVFSGLAAQALHNSSLYHKEALARASLESILRDAPDVVISTDLAGIIDFVSPSSARVLGYTPDDILGRPAADLYLDESTEPGSGEAVARRLMRQLWTEGTLSSHRILIAQDNGTAIPVALSASLLRDEDGEAIGTLGFLKDLGPMEEQTRQYRDVLQGFGYGTLMLSPTGTIGFINRKAARLLASSQKELLGLDLADLLRPAQREELLEGLAAVVKDGREIQLDLSVAQPDGRRLPVHAILTPARFGRRTGVAVGLQDKSELEALAQSGRLMALGQMVAGVGHEINNPVNHILLAARELEEELPQEMDGEVHRFLDIILRNGQRIRDLVRELRQTARPGELRLEPLAVEELIERSLSFFKRRFAQQGIACNVSVEPNLPRVSADTSRLQQVLVNLLINAEEAMDCQEGPKSIHVSAHRGGEGEVELTVCDTGSGVPEAIRDRIFDPFYTTKAPNRGTGLGLSISRSILENHGGNLRVTASEVGRGACFRLTLRVAEGNNPANTNCEESKAGKEEFDA